MYLRQSSRKGRKNKAAEQTYFLLPRITWFGGKFEIEVWQLAGQEQEINKGFFPPSLLSTTFSDFQSKGKSLFLGRPDQL